MMDRMISNSDAGEVLARALAGERLGLEDGLRLFASDDLAAIGAVADEIKHRVNGDRVYYVVNRHINYTDICVNRCRFCAFSRREGEPDAYLMSIEEVLARAEEYWDSMRFTELHIVGGCHPTLALDYYTSMLSALREMFPTVHLQAFTAVEIAHVAACAGLGVRETLTALRDAGLGSIPGGGAEVFSPRVREIVCPEKLPAADWIAVMREAHSLGIRSNATMLYGHVEEPRELVEHMLAIRALQDETGGLLTFIPLKFHPGNTRLDDIEAKLSAADDLKLYSIARLLLDNIAHIKVFWIMLGLKQAQVALSFGADDFDGTVVEEKITHRAGATTPQGLTVEELTELIRETGNTPVERDTLYNEVRRDASGVFAIS